MVVLSKTTVWYGGFVFVCQTRAYAFDLFNLYVAFEGLKCHAA